MAEAKKSIVLAVLPSLQQADQAIEELLNAGFEKEQIGFVVRETDEIKQLLEAKDSQQAAQSSLTGAVSGGVLGGLISALAVLAIPGIGPLLSAGILAAAGGAVAGSFIGLMSTLGLSEQEIQWYVGELEAGHPVVAVRANSRYSEALAILQSHGGYDMTRKRGKEAHEKESI